MRYAILCRTSTMQQRPKGMSTVEPEGGATALPTPEQTKKELDRANRNEAKGARYFEFWGFVLVTLSVVTAICYGETGRWDAIDLNVLHIFKVLALSLMGYLVICFAWTKVRPEVVSHHYDRHHEDWVTFALGALFVVLIAFGLFLVYVPISDGPVQKHTDFAVLTIVLYGTWIYLHVRAGNHFLKQYRASRGQHRELRAQQKEHDHAHHNAEQANQGASYMHDQPTDQYPAVR
jgi:hypothetical protein